MFASREEPQNQVLEKKREAGWLARTVSPIINFFSRPSVSSQDSKQGTDESRKRHRPDFANTEKSTSTTGVNTTKFLQSVSESQNPWSWDDSSCLIRKPNRTGYQAGGQQEATIHSGERRYEKAEGIMDQLPETSKRQFEIQKIGRELNEDSYSNEMVKPNQNKYKGSVNMAQSRNELGFESEVQPPVSIFNRNPLESQNLSQPYVDHTQMSGGLNNQFSQVTSEKRFQISNPFSEPLEEKSNLMYEQNQVHARLNGYAPSKQHNKRELSFEPQPNQPTNMVLTPCRALNYSLSNFNQTPDTKQQASPYTNLMLSQEYLPNLNQTPISIRNQLPYSSAPCNNQQFAPYSTAPIYSRYYAQQYTSFEDQNCTPYNTSQNIGPSFKRSRCLPMETSTQPADFDTYYKTHLTGKQFQNTQELTSTPYSKMSLNPFVSQEVTKNRQFTYGLKRGLNSLEYRKFLQSTRFHPCKWIDYFDYNKAKDADAADKMLFSQKRSASIFEETCPTKLSAEMVSENPKTIDLKAELRVKPNKPVEAHPVESPKPVQSVKAAPPDSEELEAKEPEKAALPWWMENLGKPLKVFVNNDQNFLNENENESNNVSTNEDGKQKSPVTVETTEKVEVTESAKPFSNTEALEILTPLSNKEQVAETECSKPQLSSLPHTSNLLDDNLFETEKSTNLVADTDKFNLFATQITPDINKKEPSNVTEEPKSLFSIPTQLITQETSSEKPKQLSLDAQLEEAKSITDDLKEVKKSIQMLESIFPTVEKKEEAPKATTEFDFSKPLPDVSTSTSAAPAPSIFSSLGKPNDAENDSLLKTTSKSSFSSLGGSYVFGNTAMNAQPPKAEPASIFGASTSIFDKPFSFSPSKSTPSENPKFGSIYNPSQTSTGSTAFGAQPTSIFALPSGKSEPAMSNLNNQSNNASKLFGSTNDNNQSSLFSSSSLFGTNPPQQSSLLFKSSSQSANPFLPSSGGSLFGQSTATQGTANPFASTVGLSDRPPGRKILKLKRTK